MTINIFTVSNTAYLHFLCIIVYDINDPIISVTHSICI